jgi:hypothetical protein
MRVFLLFGLMLAAYPGAGRAAPRVLTDGQLEQAAAGAMPQQPPVHCLACGVRPPPVVPPGGSPPVNPGGPILISCTIGVGCTTTPYRSSAH